MSNNAEFNDSTETLLKKILTVLATGGGGGGGGGLTNPVELIEFNTATAEEVDAPGELAWDIEEETLDIGLVGGAILKVGQELHFHVKNQTASNIAKGVLVQYAGTDGNSGKILIEPWDGTQLAKTLLGLTLQQIDIDENGYVTAFGKVRGIQTNGGNYGQTWTSGQILWADPSGGLTNVQPAAPSTKTSVAVVINAHASNGTLFVRPLIGSNLGEDELVELTLPIADGDTLVYNLTNGRFQNQQPTGGGGGADLQEVWLHAGI